MRRVLTSLTCVVTIAATVSVVQRAAVADPPPAGTSIVLAAGLNNLGQLGTGTTGNAATPVANKLPVGTTVTAVAAGYVHSLALTSSGSIYAWGDNTYGELGNGTNSTTASLTPALVNSPAGVTFTAVAVGYYDSLALASDGSVYAWGYNGFGALGISAAVNPTSPTHVNLPAGTTVTKVSAGYGHSLFLTSTGSVYAAGLNNVGQLGNGTLTNTTGTTLVHLPTGTTASDIAAGYAHSLAISSTGGVLSWGYNAFGQLGNNSVANSPVPVAVSLGSATATGISAGLSHSVALTSTGGVFAWGDNSGAQLGNGTQTGTSKVPVAVNLAGATAVSINAGYAHNVARTSTGGVLAWGYNQFGQAGVGTVANVLSPTTVKLPPGANVTLVGLSPYSDSTLFVIAPVATTTILGSSANPSTTGQAVTFTATVTPTDGTGTVSFTADAATLPGCGAVTLKLVGTSWQASCTTGSLGGGTHAIAATYSGTSTYLASTATLSPQTVSTAQGKIVGWGYNGTAELGNGSTSSAVVPVAAALPAGTLVTSAVVGYAHGLALATTGAVYAWGDNTYGELGTGSTSPTGTNSTPTLVSLPAGVTVTAVSVGFYTSYLLTSSGAVYAWGLNNLGQLGTGNFTNLSTPTKVNLPAGVVAASVSAGFAHALALTSSGAVYAWGWNVTGQLGNQTTANSSTPVLAKLPAGVQATAVAAGYEHSLAKTSTGAYAWGDNTYGELGTGNTTSSNVPVAVSLGTTSISGVSAGYLTSSARTATGGVVAWGLNNLGQLGDGTINNATAPVAVALPAGVTVTTAIAEYSNGVALTTTGDVYAWG
ncbi:MAG: hypothetical protein QOG80_2705, partial [Pseudonocardiales bacterium]|nr:hypothetical protein [Pseudonocardiales bacterium]